MAKIISISEAVDLIHDGMTVGVSGFGALARNFESRILPKN